VYNIDMNAIRVRPEFIIIIKKYTVYSVVLALLIVVIGLLLPPNINSRAAGNLTITTITWNVIGLDRQDVFTGPNQFPVGARVCNTGDTDATNLVVDFEWDSGNPYISLSSNNTQSITILPPSTCHDFYFNAIINRDESAKLTARRYHVTASADGLASVSTQVPRQLFVQELDQNINENLGSITGPTSVLVGQSYTYILQQSTVPDQQQLVNFIDFPSDIFNVQSIDVEYSTPAGGMNNKTYADACGWDDDPNSPTYLQCVGPAPSDFPDGVAGGTVQITYTVQVVSAGTAELKSLFYGYDEDAYAYQYDQNSTSLTVIAFDQTEDTPTATNTQTVTNTPTITGTPPTATASATPTITGTPPTATPTFTGTPPTPTATGTITPYMSITKAASASIVKPGNTLTFTIKVSNTGSAPAVDVTVTDNINSVLNISSVSTTKGTYTVNTSTRTVTVNVGSLSPNQSATITIVTKVNTTATTTATYTNYARLSHKYGGVTFSINSNTVSFTVQISGTLPPTGLAPINPDYEEDSGIFLPLLIICIVLGLSGLVIIIQSLRLKSKGSPWTDWFTKTGIILISAGVLFGLLAIAVKPGSAFTALLIKEPGKQESVEDAATTWNPTEEGPFFLLPTPTELESLPDYPIPTPNLKITPGSDEPAPDTSAITRIVIPSIEVDTIVKYVPLDGLTWLISGLKQEVAWMGETSWPGLGGNTGLAGHITLRDGSNGPFRYLDDLQSGDIVNLYTEENIYTYKVRSRRVVDGDDLSVLEQTDYPQLLLITCADWDKDIYMYLKRVIVYSDLVDVQRFIQSSQSN
jgi:LPXTG-site transpeptidase (sortase) family protein